MGLLFLWLGSSTSRHAFQLHDESREQPTTSGEDQTIRWDAIGTGIRRPEVQRMFRNGVSSNGDVSSFPAEVK